MKSALCSLAAAAALTLTLTGCNVSSDKHGDNDNVHIGTPFGSMNVKTNDATDTSSIGIALYPGAKPYKDKDDDGDNKGNKHSADINMSFGDFHLGVHAASFITPDSQDKVLAFYKKDLARYGEVITCRGNETVGSPDRTSQGLTCNDKDKNHVSTGDSSGSELELRTGSPSHQHIVGVSTKDGGTKIGIVALELPSHLGHHDGDTPQ
ncbi:MAG: hypothetical protein V4555_07920 [Acidobacteriota bacterium]